MHLPTVHRWEEHRPYRPEHGLIVSISEAQLPESHSESFALAEVPSTWHLPSIRHVQEKMQRTELAPVCCLTDLTKASDTVNRATLWAIIRKLVCPRKFVLIIRLFHDDMTGEVLSDGATSAVFDIINGVSKQW